MIMVIFQIWKNDILGTCIFNHTEKKLKFDTKVNLFQKKLMNYFYEKDNTFEIPLLETDWLENTLKAYGRATQQDLHATTFIVEFPKKQGEEALNYFFQIIPRMILNKYFVDCKEKGYYLNPNVKDFNQFR